MYSDPKAMSDEDIARGLEGWPGRGPLHAEAARRLRKLGEAREALRNMIVDVQDEHEAHEAEDEGFIVAVHVPYGDVLRARRVLQEIDR